MRGDLKKKKKENSLLNNWVDRSTRWKVEGGAACGAGTLSAQEHGADGEKSSIPALPLPIIVTLSANSTPILACLVNDVRMLTPSLITSQGVCKDQI